MQLVLPFLILNNIFYVKEKEEKHENEGGT